ncbi:MAG: hypothetical protein JXA66_06325 [Oligoflexia bacterium]|nr:hypothetical protein [Oligoflexia bacterium]
MSLRVILFFILSTAVGLLYSGVEDKAVADDPCSNTCNKNNIVTYDNDIIRCSIETKLEIESVLGNTACLGEGPFNTGYAYLATLSETYDSTKLKHGHRCNYEALSKKPDTEKACPGLFNKMKYLANQMNFLSDLLKKCAATAGNQKEMPCSMLQGIKSRQKRELGRKFNFCYKDFKSFESYFRTVY